MALPPPSATNEEVRLAINILKAELSGHDFKFVRNKWRSIYMGTAYYATWPYADCKGCGIRIFWDTYLKYSNKWVSRNIRPFSIYEHPTCEHVKMFEALE